MITLEQMNDEREIQNLSDQFAILADDKNAEGQGELFLADGILEFQFGYDGEIHTIHGRKEMVKAFSSTIVPCVGLYHINGQKSIKLNGSEAFGTAYCVTTLINEKDGRKTASVNDVRYQDEYKKVDGKWYISKRRSIFVLSESHEFSE
jgi:hypothetical protein